MYPAEIALLILRRVFFIYFPHFTQYKYYTNIKTLTAILNIFRKAELSPKFSF